MIPKNDLPSIIEKHCLRQVGGSFYLAIPKKWIDRYGLEAGDEIGIFGDEILKLVPTKEAVLT